MSTGADNRIVLLLDRLALFLGALGALLRWTVHAATAGSGTNVFIHLLFWVALAVWFAGRALSGGATWRFTGFEFAFIAFSIVSLVSVLRASYRLPALEHAFRDLSFALLFMLAVQAFGARTLLSLLLPTLAALSVYGLLQAALLFPQIDPGKLPLEMARRARTHEPWATFLGPNQFAGFLVLLLPVLAGYARDSRVRWPAGAVLALGLIALVLTGSTGGFVSLAAGAAAFAALAFTRSRGRRSAVLAGGLLAAVLTIALLTTPLLDAIARKSISMRVRQVYWQAAGKIVRDAPVGGVGLDNYREHYFEAKPDAPWETVHAHNDYLQVLAETGLFGFLAFAGILALGLRKAMTTRAGPPEERPEPDRMLPLAAGLAFLGAAVATGIFQDGASIAVWGCTALAWIAARVLFRQAAPDPALPWTRLGAAAGLVALLVEMGVDFEFYEPGVAMTLVLGLALVALLRGEAPEVRIPRTACAGATAVLALVALPLLVGVVPRLLAADAETAEARGGPPQSARLAESAVRHVPVSAELRELLAQTSFYQWTQSRPAAARDQAARMQCQQAEEIAVQAIDDAIALRPRWAPLRAMKATFHRHFHRFYVELEKSPATRSSINEGKAREHLRTAAEQQEKAVSLYPSFAPTRYALARLLDEDGRPAEALPHYREALRLTQLADLEPWVTDRMRLLAIERARCLVRMGERARAVRLLHDAYSGNAWPPPSELAEETDALMRPVLDDAAKAIIESDKK